MARQRLARGVEKMLEKIAQNAQIRGENTFCVLKQSLDFGEIDI
jgi:hypothetical protein